MSEDCDDYLRQLVAYKMLYEKDTYEPAKYKVSHGVLVFLEPVKRASRKYNLEEGSYIERKVPITDEMTRKLEDVIRKVSGQINNLEFEKFLERDPKKCKNCNFDSMCWG